MIQANEIRVGNMFIRELGTQRGLEYEHEFVLTEEYMGKLFSDNISIALQDLFPIPLTPEILDRCGFEMYEEYDIMAYKDTPICYYFDGVEYCFKYGLDSDLTICACNYLHQLQNLYYSLTGTELEVKI